MNMHLATVRILLLVGVAVLGLGMSACSRAPAPTPDSRIDRVIERLDGLEDAVGGLKEQLAATLTPRPTPTPTSPSTPQVFHRVNTELYSVNLERARQYLRSRYDPELGLVFEAQPPGGWRVPSQVNLVKNGDIDVGTDLPLHWNNSGASAVVSRESLSGGHALRLLGANQVGSWESSLFQVKGDVSYQLGGYFKGDAGEHFGLVVRFYEDAGGTIFISEERIGLKGRYLAYEMQTEEVKAPSNAVSGDMSFLISGPSTGDLLGDGFFMNEIRFYTMDHVYWLGDNLLAAMALKPYDPEMASVIFQKVAGYSPFDQDDKSDVLDGNQIPLEPFIQERVTVEEEDTYIVFGALDSDSVLAPLEDYADVMLMYALQAWGAGDKSRARELMQTVIEMWDGTGLIDGPTRFHRSYAPYKLALFLIALQVIGEPFDDFKNVERDMWANQDASGGIVTGINFKGAALGGPNTETTALVMLVYDRERIAMLKGESETNQH